ncbi:TetR/AcrR family transcriptional regulator [Methyloceanibacter sp.]|uniref:TetR/AcrR family transcriptional regulator n=1 Tax=Methyloceanibacter sp. TaxID=1965321 RepID=UPI002D68CC31|nr:TetR/AcrR family transcriptional regulator [Methyloceanibacter sp.]HZP08245.1 TetR/AcrR family transcriptional regulator [Methyloceanibacter sp.]
MAETKRAAGKRNGEAAPRKRERKDTRPQEIVAAAFEEFVSHGYAATRLEDVAARARVSKGLPYLYFKTKEELFKAVVRSVISPIFDAMRERMLTTEMSCEAFLKGPFLAFMQELVASRRVLIARLLIAEGPKHPELTKFYYEQVIAKGRETIQAFIDRGIARGEFKPTPLRDFPQLVIAPALMAVIWRTLFERHHHLDTDALLATHIDLLLDAIRAPGAAAQTDGGGAP